MNLDSKGMVHCDGFGCGETHPLEHEFLGDRFYGTGRWLGWVYVDLNRPDLFPDILRFCGTFCLQHWLDRQCIDRTRGWHSEKAIGELDEALRNPDDQTARARAGLKRKRTA